MNCSACGKPAKAIVSIGSTPICRQCEPDITAEIATLREAGKPVNVAHIARRIYRETNSAGNYLLRDIPADLWDRAKHRAIDEKCNLRGLILNALDKYLDK